MKEDTKGALCALAAGVGLIALLNKMRTTNEQKKRIEKRNRDELFLEKDLDPNQKIVMGIGAVKKRRIYKELSLAQQAGVDFTKPYDELTKDEVKALQRVSNETGYTETYYKSLQKAYNAISGIGETYDVVNADGDTVLTWIEDPEAYRGAAHFEDPERYAALREAHEIEDEREWALQNKEQNLNKLEAQLSEQRKRLKKAGLSSQMALFGCGYTPEVETELYEIWREQIEYGETEYDYETWRRVFGDEYAPDVIKYMR